MIQNEIHIILFRTQDCEEAYFKMDNVLIDERRIKVDFSQSVSKMEQYRLPKGWKLGASKASGKLAIKGQHRGEGASGGKDYELVFDEVGV